MRNRTMEFGIRITADGRVAVVEAGKTNAAMGEIGKTAQGVVAQIDRLDASIRRVASGAATLAGIGLGAGLLRDTVRSADAMTNLDSRLRLVTASLYEQQRASDAVFQISQRTRQALDATGDLYYKVAKGADTLGLSQQRIIGLTETISQSVALSGASAESAKASIMQFGQALASGTLRGDELNSVMEQTPALAEAIAKGMGKTTGELRALGEQGAITVQEIVAALEKQAPEIARQFADLTPTISGAWQNVESAALRYVGQADKASGASAVLASSLAVVAEQFDGVVATASMVTAVGLGGYLGKAAAARIETLALASAARAAAVQYDALGMAIATTTTKASAAGAVVGALGGPIGLVTTALTVGVTAWALWGNEADAAGKKAFDASQALADLERRSKYGDGDVAAARERLDKLNAELPGIFEPRELDETIKEIVALEKYLAKVEAMETKTVASISEAWGGLHRTKAQQRAAEIAELDKAYVAEAAKIKGNADLQLRLASEYQVKLQVINDKYKGKKKVDEGFVDAAGEQAKSYAQQYEAAIKLARGIELEAVAGRKLLPVQAALATARATLTAAQAQELEKLLAGALLIEKRTAAEQEAVAAAQLHADAVQSMIAPLEDQAARLEREVETYGMTEAAIQAAALARLEEARAIAAQNGAWPEHLAFLDREIAARQRLAAGADQKDALDAAKKVADEEAKYWERIHEDLGRSLTDELMKGGKGAGELLENYFKTLVFRPVIQGVVNLGMNALGFGGNVGAGGTVGGGMNLLSAGNSAYNMFTGGGMLGGFSAGAASMASELALGSSFVGPSASLASGAVGAGASAAAATGSAAGAGAVSSLAAAAPYAAAVVAAISLLSGMGKGGTPHAGGVAFSEGTGYTTPKTWADINANFVDTSGTWQFAESDWMKRNNAEVSKSLGAMAQGLAATLNGITSRYGAGRDYAVGLAFSGDGEDPTRGRLGVAGADNREIYEFRARYAKDMAAGMSEFAADIPAELLKALRGIDLSPVVDAYLDKSQTATRDLLEGMADDQANAILAALQGGWLDEYLAQAGNVGKSFQDMTADIVEFAAVANLKPVFDELGLDIYKVGLDLADRFGGADALASGLSAYYDATRTESEKLAYSVAQVRGEFARWNVATPATVADLRSMEDVVVALGDESADAYAALVKVAPAFAQIATAANASVDAMLGRLGTLTEASWLAQANAVLGTNLAKLPTRDEVQEYLEALRADPFGNAERIAQVETLFDGWSSLMDDTTASYKALAAASRAAGEDIADLVRDLTINQGGLATPEALLGNTRSAYYASLDQVRQQAAAGNYDNVDRLVGDARAYVEAQKGYSASSDITQTVIARIVDELRGLGIGDGMAFADGGVFTNGIVTRPTYFNRDVMGERTPEAIMPLVNIGGSLGVRALGSDNSAELAALRSEVVALRTALERLLAGQIAATVESSQRSAQTIVDGQIAAAKTQSWAARSAPALV